MDQVKRSKIAGFFQRYKPPRAFYLAGVASASWAIGVASPEIVEGILHSGFAEALSHAPLADSLGAAVQYFRGAASYTAGLARGALDGFGAFNSLAYDNIRLGLEGIAQDAASLSQVARNEFRDRAMALAEIVAVARSTVSGAVSTITSHLPRTAAEIVPWCVSAGTVIAAFHEKVTKCKDVVLDAIKAVKFFKRAKPEVVEADKVTEAKAAEAGITPQVMNNLTINIAIGGDATAQAAVATLTQAIRTGDPAVVSDPAKLLERLEQAIAVDDVAKAKKEHEDKLAADRIFTANKLANERRQEEIRRRALEMFANARPDAMHADRVVNTKVLTGMDDFDEFSATFKPGYRPNTSVNAILQDDVIASNIHPRPDRPAVAANDNQYEGVFLNKLQKFAKTATNDPFMTIDAKKEISDTSPDLGSP